MAALPTSDTTSTYSLENFCIQTFFHLRMKNIKLAERGLPPHVYDSISFIM